MMIAGIRSIAREDIDERAEKRVTVLAILCVSKQSCSQTPDNVIAAVANIAR
jgi:hypothetical protein